MKKIVLIAFAAIAFATASQAQDSTMSKGHHMKKHDMKEHHGDMMSELNLTSEQQEKMKKLREDNHTKIDAVKNNASLSDEQKQEQIKKLRSEFRNDSEAVLTEDQKAKWKQLRKEQMEHRKEARMGGDSTMQR